MKRTLICLIILLTSCGKSNDVPSPYFITKKEELKPKTQNIVKDTSHRLDSDGDLIPDIIELKHNLDIKRANTDKVDIYEVSGTIDDTKLHSYKTNEVLDYLKYKHFSGDALSSSEINLAKSNILTSVEKLQENIIHHFLDQDKDSLLNLKIRIKANLLPTTLYLSYPELIVSTFNIHTKEINEIKKLTKQITDEPIILNSGETNILSYQFNIPAHLSVKIKSGEIKLGFELRDYITNMRTFSYSKVSQDRSISKKFNTHYLFTTKVQKLLSQKGMTFKEMLEDNKILHSIEDDQILHIQGLLNSSNSLDHNDSSLDKVWFKHADIDYVTSHISNSNLLSGQPKTIFRNSLKKKQFFTLDRSKLGIYKITGTIKNIKQNIQTNEITLRKLTMHKNTFMIASHRSTGSHQINSHKCKKLEGEIYNYICKNHNKSKNLPSTYFLNIENVKCKIKSSQTRIISRSFEPLDFDIERNANKVSIIKLRNDLYLSSSHEFQGQAQTRITLKNPTLKVKDGYLSSTCPNLQRCKGYDTNCLLKDFNREAKVKTIKSSKGFDLSTYHIN